MQNLRENWQELASKYSEDDELTGELWKEIEQAYTNKNRHYHTLAHLEYMTDKAFRFQDSIDDFKTIMFSIFYHDIVYNIFRGDNERRSAGIATDRLARLGVPSEKTVKSRNQILATKGHKDNSDKDSCYFIDFDLAILGESPEIYRDYTKKIRKEYAIYPDFLYKRGRKKMLKNFLERDSIYKTEDLRKDYEKQARENLKSELEAL
jgi:predicted metal-dependent HD superfamily phosphohydrolase